MSVVSITSSKNAKTGGEAGFVKTKSASVLFQQITEIIKRAWPKKTAAHVSYLTGASERAVQFWLAGETRMTLEHVASLLKTEEGYPILKAIMGDAAPEWWLVAQTAQSIRSSKKAIKREQDRMAATRAQLDLLDQ